MDAVIGGGAPVTEHGNIYRTRAIYWDDAVIGVRSPTTAGPGTTITP